jgi:hypothetical protein
MSEVLITQTVISPPVEIRSDCDTSHIFRWISGGYFKHGAIGALCFILSQNHFKLFLLTGINSSESL